MVQDSRVDNKKPFFPLGQEQNIDMKPAESKVWGLIREELLRAAEISYQEIELPWGNPTVRSNPVPNSTFSHPWTHATLSSNTQLEPGGKGKPFL